jgi:AAA domain
MTTTTHSGIRTIEVLGAPASGKSSVAAALAAVPGLVTVKDHGPGDLPPLAWAALRAWPVLTVAPPGGVGRGRWMAWAGRLGAAPQVVRHRVRRGAETVLLDQGPAYTLGRLATLRRRPRGRRWWQDRVAESVRLLDVLVLLDADTATLAKRLRRRSKLHLGKDLSEAALAAYLDGERETCRGVAEAFEAAGGSVLRLDSGVTSPRACVAAITAVLAGGQAVEPAQRDAS